MIWFWREPWHSMPRNLFWYCNRFALATNAAGWRPVSRNNLDFSEVVEHVMLGVSVR